MAISPADRKSSNASETALSEPKATPAVAQHRCRQRSAHEVGRQWFEGPLGPSRSPRSTSTFTSTLVHDLETRRPALRAQNRNQSGGHQGGAAGAHRLL